MKVEEIKARIAQPIDLHSLETELQEHVYLFQAATQNLSELRLDVARKKQAIDLLESQLNLKVRQENDSQGVKTTEKLVEAQVKAHASYTKAFDDYLVAKYEFDVVDSMKDVFLARESAIKNLVQLYQSQYWSLSSIDKAMPAADPNGTGEFKTRRA